METSSHPRLARRPAPPAARRAGLDADLESPGAAVARLPVLRDGWRSPPFEGWATLALRLQAALWEVAGRAGVVLRPATSTATATRLLVRRGAISPEAGAAVAALAPVLGAGAAGESPDLDPAEAARLVERLVGYLALRARFG